MVYISGETLLARQLRCLHELAGFCLTKVVPFQQSRMDRAGQGLWTTKGSRRSWSRPEEGERRGYEEGHRRIDHDVEASLMTID